MPAKKNVLILPGLFPKYDGDISGIFVLDYINSIKDEFNVFVLYLHINGSGYKKFEIVNGVHIYRFCLMNKKTIPSFIKPLLYVLLTLKGLLMAHKIKDIEIIHTHGTIFYGNLALLIKKITKAKVLITEHTGPFSKLTKNKISRFITKHTIEHADALLTVSEDLKKQVLESGIHPKKIIVTYNPVDTNLFIPGNIKVRDTHKNIIFAGRLEDYKGALRTVKAFLSIRQNFADWRFTIIGDGPETELIKELLLKEKVESDVVQLKGKLSKKEIAAEFQKASFFVFPSEHETFGLVLAEALSAGLPVIAGNETAPKEYIDETCGLLIPPKNTDELATALQTMIKNYLTYNPEKIRQAMIEKFSFVAFGKRLSKIYNDSE